MMEVEYRNDEAYIVFTNRNARSSEVSLGALSFLTDSTRLTGLMLDYCAGKADTTIKSWVGRFKACTNRVIDECKMISMPHTSKEWRTFIKNLYGTILTSDCYTAKLETRVDIWNKNVKPFLQFIQQRDHIPVDVIIPVMKAIGQANKNSSFKVNIAGAATPKKVEHNDSLTKLLTPISLSRSDPEYLDEVHYDLNTKKNKLHDCLYSYWKAIKAHYEFGKNVISSVDADELLDRISNNKWYLYTLPCPGKQIPPRKSHIAKMDTLKGFANYIFLLNYHGGFYRHSLIYKEQCFPAKNPYSMLRNSGLDPFPNTSIENIEDISVGDRINWCLGNLSSRDVSYISALLIMLNPKFTPESLLFSKLTDKHGKQQIEVGDCGVSFTINKERAKTKKTEWLDDTSVDIFTTIIAMTSNKREDISNETVKSSLFLTVNQKSDDLVIPVKSRVSAYITGLISKEAYQCCLSDYFPSLDDYGMGVGTITHSKIRNTEGVLEWFRTGSVKAASRKLGNTSKVALEHYIPKDLIAAWSTRQVRRFQNLLIISATIGEEHMLDAVDFNTITEVNKFLMDMMPISDNGNNPLTNYLKEKSLTKTSRKITVPTGELIAQISKEALGVLYIYSDAAAKSGIDAKKLAKVDSNTSIAPLAFISLSMHLSYTLANHPDSIYRAAHKAASKMAKKYYGKINWSELFIAKKNAK